MMTQFLIEAEAAHALVSASFIHSLASVFTQYCQQQTIK